jgi:hypothetical protein
MHAELGHPAACETMLRADFLHASRTRGDTSCNCMYVHVGLHDSVLHCCQLPGAHGLRLRTHNGHVSSQPLWFVCIAFLHATCQDMCMHGQGTRQVCAGVCGNVCTSACIVTSAGPWSSCPCSLRCLVSSAVSSCHRTALCPTTLSGE